MKVPGENSIACGLSPGYDRPLSEFFSSPFPNFTEIEPWQILPRIFSRQIWKKKKCVIKVIIFFYNQFLQSLSE